MKILTVKPIYVLLALVVDFSFCPKIESRLWRSTNAFCFVNVDGVMFLPGGGGEPQHYML